MDDSGNLITGNWSTLHDDIKNQKNCFQGDIESLFSASNFLISPINTPDRFIRHEYFLTSQQREIEKKITGTITNDGFSFYGLTGVPGTGKTLLLYDIGTKLSFLGKTCIVHCGMLPDGLVYLNGYYTALDVIPVKSVNKDFSFSEYNYLLIDESHRIYPSQFDLVVQQTQDLNLKTIFSYDAGQVLSTTEESNSIATRIEALPHFNRYCLKKKIRTNKELASFIKRLMNLHDPERYDSYPSVTLAYANDQTEAQWLLSQLVKSGFVFINFSGSRYHLSTYDIYPSKYDTHHVIGQEFDSVAMVLDQTFAYDHNGILRAKRHPNPDYLYRNLLYQGLSRVRERLALIVVDNPQVFEEALAILQG